jgi:hypothetical protein
LIGLPVGLHNVTVYAWDSAGNVGASKTVNFTITVRLESKPESEPSLVLPLAASTVSIAVVAGGVLVYWKKHKR